MNKAIIVITLLNTLLIAIGAIIFWPMGRDFSNTAGSPAPITVPMVSDVDNYTGSRVVVDRNGKLRVPGAVTMGTTVQANTLATLTSAQADESVEQVVLNGEVTLDSDLELLKPIRINSGGRINTGGNALTVSSSFSAGQYQVLSGSDVVFSPGSTDFIRPEWVGVLTSNSETVNTINYKDLTSLINSAGGVKIKFSTGTYNGNWNLSGLILKPIIIEGAGKHNTILNSTSGITLDLCSSSRVVARGVTIQSTGGAVALLTGRYSIAPLYGAGHYFENVRVSGSPTVAGHYACGSEVSNYIACEFIIKSNAPNAYISVNNTDIAFTSPNGILQGTSAGVWEFNKCVFVKDSGSTGENVVIGSSLAALTFRSSYFHGAPYSSSVAFIGDNNYNVKIADSMFESNYLSAGQYSYGILFSGSTNNRGLQIKNNYFIIKKYSPNSPCINMDSNSSIYESTITGNKDVNGHGITLSRVWSSTIEWRSATSILSAQADPADPSITVSDSHNIYDGDEIYIGNSLKYDGGGSQTPPEIHLVSSVSGTTVNLDGTAISTMHPSRDLVTYGRVAITSYALDSTFITSFPIDDSGASLMVGNDFQLGGPEQDRRWLIGQQSNLDRKRAMTIIYGPMSDEPNRPKSGMFVGVSSGHSWSSTTDLINTAKQNFPAWYSDRWYAMPLTISGVLLDYDPPTIAVGESVVQSIEVTGAEFGDYAIASSSISVSGLSVSAFVSAADTVNVVLANNTTGPVDLANHSLRAVVIKH